jgi:hypothetical protein
MRCVELAILIEELMTEIPHLSLKMSTKTKVGRYNYRVGGGQMLKWFLRKWNEGV